MPPRRRVRIVVQALEGFVDNVIKAVVLNVVANLKTSPQTGYGTPVDTGWARANWIPRIGAPVEAPVGSKEAVSEAAQEAAVARIAATYKMAQGVIFISNGVPYIVPLNEGSSKQAPRGFVQNGIVVALEQTEGSF